MQVDVIVVGSGLCGTLAAKHLEEAGHSVLVLEAGPGVPSSLPGDVVGFAQVVAPLTATSETDWAFRAPKGFEWHRVRARGGRTLLWGGWMERPPREYFESRKSNGAAWPANWPRQLGRWVRHAEHVLSVRSGKRGPLHRKLGALGLDASTKRESVLVGKRRMLTAVDLSLQSEVRCNSPVVRLRSSPKGLAVELASGAQVRGRRVVLAASPIETARIIEQSVPAQHRRARVTVFDHLIAGAIGIGVRQASTEHPPDAAEPSAVIHPEPGSRRRFTTEIRGPTPLERLDAEDLESLGFTREQAVNHSFYVVFAMGETDPKAPRMVEFVRNETDALRRPLPRFIRRAHTASETALAKKMNRQVMRLARLLAGPGNPAFPIYDALDFSSGGHEVGTCLDRVDAQGHVAALPGVFIADGAAIPAATDRHPSLTLAANALRVADALSQTLKARS